MENKWTAAHIAERNEEVQLVRPLRIWRFIHTSWKVWKNSEFPTEDKTILAGTKGIVIDRETFGSMTIYTVRFGETIVDHVHPYLIEPVEVT